MNHTDVSTFNTLLNKKLKVNRSLIFDENDTSATPPENTILELVKVEEKKRDTHDTISLIFFSDAEKHLPQKTYSLSSEEFEPQDIFIVPIGERKEGSGTERKKVGYLYQAIFCKLNES